MDYRLFPFPTLTAGTITDGAVISAPSACQKCAAQPCTIEAGSDLMCCSFGYSYQRVSPNTVAIGLTVAGNTSSPKAATRFRNAPMNERVHPYQVASAISSATKVFDEQASRHDDKRSADILEVANTATMADLLAGLRSESREAIGQVHDYESLAIQIRQIVDALLLIDDNSNMDHVEQRLASATHEMKALYWTSRLMQTKLAGSRLLLVDNPFENDIHGEWRLHGIVHKYRQIFHYQCNEKDVSIQLLGESFGKIRGSQLALEHIPLVLIDNATKYAPPGTNVDCRLEEADGFVSLSVSSVGPKIRKSERESIFLPYKRAKAAQEQGQESGMGLGLALLRRCCEELDATSSVEQEPQASNSKGFWTTFSVRFRLI